MHIHNNMYFCSWCTSLARTCMCCSHAGDASETQGNTRTLPSPTELMLSKSFAKSSVRSQATSGRTWKSKYSNTSFTRRAEAVKEFRKNFHEKSGSKWEDVKSKLSNTPFAWRADVWKSSVKSFVRSLATSGRTWKSKHISIPFTRSADAVKEFCKIFCKKMTTHTAGGQNSKRLYYVAGKPWHWTVFCTFHSAVTH